MLCPGFALKRAEGTFTPDPIKVWTVLLGLKGAALEEVSGFQHCPENPGAREVRAVLGLGPEHPALHVAGGLRPARGGGGEGLAPMLAGLSPSSGSGKLWVHRGGRAKPGAAARAHLGVSPRRRASSPGGSGLSGSGLRELYRAEREPRGRPRWAPRPGVLPAPAARAGPCPRMRPAPTRPLLPSRHPPLGSSLRARRPVAKTELLKSESLSPGICRAAGQPQPPE